MASIKKVKHKKVKEGDFIVAVEKGEFSLTLTVGEVDCVGSYWGGDDGYFEIENTTIYSDQDDVVLFRIKQEED